MLSGMETIIPFEIDAEHAVIMIKVCLKKHPETPFKSLHFHTFLANNTYLPLSFYCFIISKHNCMLIIANK